jgi:long-chain acyl-CoA synthetase
MINVAETLKNSARNHPEKTAFIFGEQEFSYRQIDQVANQVAHALRAKGIGKGDKVALSCLNLPYFPMIYYGILKAGAVCVPLSVLLKKDEIAYHLEDSDAAFYFCFEGTDELPMGQFGYDGFQQVDSCKEFVVITADPQAASPFDGISTFGQFIHEQPAEDLTPATTPEDIAVIVYTSGTTGRPKGAQLTHNNLLLNAMISADLFNMSSEDKTLIVLPLFHIFAMTTMLNAGVYRGTTNVLLPRFEAESVFGLMQKHEVTLFAGVPTMYWGLLKYDGDTSFDYEKIADNLKIAVSGGASLPVSVLEDFEEKFNVKILEGYGMSEGSPVVTFNQLDLGTKPGSIGKPIWGVDVKIVDENDEELPSGEKGQLLYRGHNVMTGYYNKPEETEEALKDGWMHSGDIAVKDEEGFYFIVDRTKDMIIRNGLNVYPREVEEVMMKHPAVSMVAIIGIPDEEKGEEIKAYVVLNKGESVEEDALIEWTKDRIAAYKYPRHIEFTESLPTSATGKILKKELRKQNA